MLVSTRAVLTENIRESRDVLRSRGPPIETEMGPLLQICHKSFTACQFRFVRFFLVLLRVLKRAFPTKVTLCVLISLFALSQVPTTASHASSAWPAVGVRQPPGPAPLYV